MRPLLAVLFTLTASTAAGEPARPNAVTSVKIERKNVFDPHIPGEDFWMFQFATKLHIKTNEKVIAFENLIPPGTLWDPLRCLRGLGSS